MAIKRPSKAPAFEPGPADLKLIEKMVRKSLEINPQMRGDKTTTTTAFLEKMRQEAVAGASSGNAGSASSSGAPQPEPPSDTRAHMIELFMAETGGQFRGQRGQLRDQIAALQAQENGLKSAAVAEVVNLLKVLIASGANPADLHRALGSHEPLLAEMGVSATDVVRLAKS